MSAGVIAAVVVVGYLLLRKKPRLPDDLLPVIPAPVDLGPGPIPSTTVTPAAASKILQAGGLKLAAPVMVH